MCNSTPTSVLYSQRCSIVENKYIEIPELILKTYDFSGRLYALQTAMEVDKKSPDCRQYLMGMMDLLEVVSQTKIKHMPQKYGIHHNKWRVYLEIALDNGIEILNHEYLEHLTTTGGVKLKAFFPGIYNSNKEH